MSTTRHFFSKSRFLRVPLCSESVTVWVCAIFLAACYRPCRLSYCAGVGNVFAVTGRINGGLSPAGRRNNWPISKIQLLSSHEGWWILLTYYLSIRLSWSFVLTRFCNLNWVTKILMQAISNDHAGRRFPTPAIVRVRIPAYGWHDL